MALKTTPAEVLSAPQLYSLKRAVSERVAKLVPPADSTIQQRILVSQRAVAIGDLVAKSVTHATVCEERDSVRLLTNMELHVFWDGELEPTTVRYSFSDVVQSRPERRALRKNDDWWRHAMSVLIAGIPEGTLLAAVLKYTPTNGATDNV